MAALRALAASAAPDIKGPVAVIDVGSTFVAEIEVLCGQPVHVLDGVEEARLSTLGVFAGFPDACGVMGDLGGGSLELVALADGSKGSEAAKRRP